MKFADYKDVRIEATKGAKGFCPICGSALIAKCGEFKINHWAHKSISQCDKWWESEKLWHRIWKNNFPVEWQEFIMHDEHTGEKHIADICSSYNLVIEFQHSHITPQERVSRETFYKNMVWVVDGTRLNRDYTRFLKAMKDFQNSKTIGHYYVGFPDECFPKNWIGSRFPVFLDFLGSETIENPNDLRNFLYCLLPNKNMFDSELVVFSRELFIKNTISGDLIKTEKKLDSLIVQPPIQRIPIRRVEPTHDLNPRTGRLERRRRF